MLLVDLWKVKVSRGIDQFIPRGNRSNVSHISGFNGPWYLNVRQRKLGTIIIQIVHILLHDSAVTGRLPKGEIRMAFQFYYQIKLKFRYTSAVPLEEALFKVKGLHVQCTVYIYCIGRDLLVFRTTYVVIELLCSYHKNTQTHYVQKHY